jgi:hypothetical protein
MERLHSVNGRQYPRSRTQGQPRPELERKRREAIGTLGPSRGQHNACSRSLQPLPPMTDRPKRRCKRRRRADPPLSQARLCSCSNARTEFESLLSRFTVLGRGKPPSPTRITTPIWYHASTDSTKQMPWADRPGLMADTRRRLPSGLPYVVRVARVVRVVCGLPSCTHDAQPHPPKPLDLSWRATAGRDSCRFGRAPSATIRPRMGWPIAARTRSMHCISAVE